jgi:hypothetical protein
VYWVKVRLINPGDLNTALPGFIHSFILPNVHKMLIKATYMKVGETQFLLSQS